MKLTSKLSLFSFTATILACGGGGGSVANPYTGNYSGAVDYFSTTNTGSTPSNSGAGTGSILADGTLRMESSIPSITMAPDVVDATVDALGTLTSARLTFVNGSGGTVTLNGTGSVTVAGSQTRIETRFPQVGSPTIARRYIFLVNKI
jgi:hypothetical protein